MDLVGPLVASAFPAALITMLPGPDTAMVLTTALRHGRRAAARAAWGVGTGLLVWGAAAALGLAAALRSGSVAYEVFRWGCAAYLFSLAVQSLRASRRTPTPDHPAREKTAPLPAPGWGYRRALLTCVLNPKLGIFFVVFLPQFIPSGAPVGRFSLALAALQAVEAVIWYLLLGRLASAARRLLARNSVRRWLDRITAVIFLGFGARLALEARP